MPNVCFVSCSNTLRRQAFRAVLIEAVRSGTIASLAVMPLGWLFRAFDLRIGHYGPRFAALFIDNPQAWHLFAQHLLIGWLSALPLLSVLVATRAARWPVLAGAAYGAAFYVAVNSLALPFYFGDLTPWQLGWTTVWPSLVGHIVFGACLGFTARRFLRAGPSRSTMTAAGAP